MPRQGLGKESILQAAMALIEEKGIAQFSMGELAKRLNVKPASLYNHVDSLHDLLEQIGLTAISRLTEAENQAIQGKQKDEALFSLAEAYRFFAREHAQLYRLILGLSKLDSQILEKGAGDIVQPILYVLSTYGLREHQQYHWQRVLRGVMVGFAVHEHAGGFSRFPVDENESYRIAIQCISEGLHRAGKEAE